jgi:hypothetical protein
MVAAVTLQWCMDGNFVKRIDCFGEKKQHLPELCTASNIFLESDEERAIINALLALQGFSV